MAPKDPSSAAKAPADPRPIRLYNAKQRFGALPQIRDALRYHYLIGLFVKRDFVALYKQSILGPLWHLISPLLMTLIFTVVFGMAVKIPTDGVPPILFYLLGVVVWTFFSSTFRQIARFFVENQLVLSKVYFPRLVIPFSVIGSKAITFAIQFALFLAIWTYYIASGELSFQPSAFLILLYLPLLAVLALGTGLLFAALTVKYRDFSFILEFLLQIWMYVTPIIYPLSLIPERFAWLARLNPLAGMVEGLRSAFLGTAEPSPALLVSGVCSTLLLLLVGLRAFGWVERSFVDTL